MLINSCLSLSSRRNVASVLLIVSVATTTLFVAGEARAQTSYTWNRTGNSSWKNNINWLPNVNNQSYPHNIGDSATFNLNTATVAAPGAVALRDSARPTL